MIRVARIRPDSRRPGISRAGFALLVLATAGGLQARTAETTQLTVEVHARAVAPGEPLRIVVRATEPLEDVRGTLDGEALFFVRESGRIRGDIAAVGRGNGADGRRPVSTGSREEANDARVAPEEDRQAGQVGGTRPSRTWSAWTVIDLDRKPGRARLSVEGRTAAAGSLRAAREVTVSKKKFPISRLNVPEKFVTPPPEVEERIERETKKLAALYASHSENPTPGHPFIRPVPGDPMGIFGARRFFNGQPRAPHPGLDLRAAEGTPVKASGPGRVVLAEDLYFSGKTVIIEHGGGLFTLYGHLSEIRVAEGNEALEGQEIGLSGATGRVTGPHLHWGAKIGNRAFDPTALLDGRLFR